MNTRSPSQTNTMSTFITSPAHVRLTSCCHALPRGSLSISKTLPFHQPKNTVLTSRNNFRGSKLKPEHPLTTLDASTGLISISALRKPTVAQQLADVSSYTRQTPYQSRPAKMNPISHSLRNARTKSSTCPLSSQSTTTWPPRPTNQGLLHTRACIRL